MLNISLTLIGALLLLYFGWGAIYQFIFSFAGLFYRKNLLADARRERRIAVFIPAYKEDAVILQTAKAALEQRFYNSDMYRVFVIADQLKKETLDALRRMEGLEVIGVSFEKSTKAKALNVALAKLKGWNFEIAVVLDADNTMSPDFLSRINARFEAGAVAIQGRRVAKNLNSPMAILDAASEDVNNHILCQGHSVLGLSVRLAGSGMAFDYRLFERVMPEVNAIGGFDKELELRLTQAGVSLEYAPEAVVLDEKISKSQAFTKQRSRWLAAQYTYARRFVPSAFSQLLRRGNVDFFNKSLQMTLPPRLVLPFILMLGSIVAAFVNTEWAVLWMACFTLNVVSFLIALPSYVFRAENILALSHVPRALFATLIALTQIGEASRHFIHTPHTHS
jgi:cellulose synthase/poly-beta-1,6-N-acetylglucosamine synthase-like glycosyltransferase